MSKLYIKGCIPVPELDDSALDLIPGDEIWTLNNGITPLPGIIPLPRVANRHFSLHGLRYELKCHGREYLEWLSATKADVYLWEKQIALWDEVTTESGGLLPRPENLFAFPIAFLRSAHTYGLTWRTYYTGSFAYMLAYVLYLNNQRHLRFKEVHITGVAFSDSALWDSRKWSADWLEHIAKEAIKQRASNSAGVGDDSVDIGYAISAEVVDDLGRAVNNLRGIRAGDESWARECIVYWCGRLEQSGVEVITDESTQLFHNKWLKTHCEELDTDDCGLYGLCSCIGG